MTSTTDSTSDSYNETLGDIVDQAKSAKKDVYATFKAAHQRRRKQLIEEIDDAKDQYDKTKNDPDETRANMKIVREYLELLLDLVELDAEAREQIPKLRVDTKWIGEFREYKKELKKLGERGYEELEEETGYWADQGYDDEVKEFVDRNRAIEWDLDDEYDEDLPESQGGKAEKPDSPP